MRHFLNLFERFRCDERGVFAVTFAVMAIVLVAMAGAVVDFVSLQQARNRAQVALDAATLALQPEIFVDGTTAAGIAEQARALIAERIGDPRIETTVAADDVVIDEPNGSLYIKAGIVVPTIFVRLVGVTELPAAVVAEATRKMLDLEVVMVLDNSGSMANYSRMTYLKQAAGCATNIIFYEQVDDNCNVSTGSTPLENVKMGIVPFTMMVNVGTQFQSADWLDWTGENAISRLNFDNDDDETSVFNGPVDRADLFDQTNTSWRGCVEARLAPYDTNDAPPDVTERLFTPMFAPDTASGNYNSYLSDVGGSCAIKTCTHVQRQQNCTTTWWGSVTCTGATQNTYTQRVGSSTTTPSASCIPADAVILSGPTTSMQGSTRTTTTTYSLLSERELQERLCKYNGTSVPDSKNSGPNAYCPYISVLPLTENVTAVQGKITAMNADGGTNIQQGTIWGYHALSSTEPLVEALPYNSGSVSKVMIVMTDGFNEPDYRSYGDTWNGTAIYQSWGFRKDGRLPDTDGIIGNENEYAAHNSKADMTATMDAKTVTTCANAKADGIKIYTIGLNPPSQATRDMLQACSSGSGFYFFPQQPSELVAVFRQIAGQLAQLRLAR